MITDLRLHESYPGTFSAETLAAVDEAKGQQSQYSTYQDYFTRGLGLDASGPETINLGQTGLVSVIDIRPKVDHDAARALVIALPMANPLDPNQIFTVGTIATANPDRRVLAFGNVAGHKKSVGVLNRMQRQEVAKGNFNPIAHRIHCLLGRKGIVSVDYAGYSLGASIVAEAAAGPDVPATRLIVIEPASVIERNLGKLARLFMTTGESLQTYVEASNQQLYNAARKDSEALLNVLSLARLTNIAIARGLTKGYFENQLHTALVNQPQLKATLAWGSKSELAVDTIMGSIASLAALTVPGRIKAIRLSDQKHALANDIYLHAAIVREGLTNLTDPL